ncbi:metal-dependent phosphohydrolase [Moritella sp. F3]|nr:metal-dependent phosphohydrolase [Moritella sp. F1]GIC83401.1 metal-dependent phosphohydrolase [Moritella sp. F3]
MIAAGVSHLESEKEIFSAENIKRYTSTLQDQIKLISSPVVTLLDTLVVTDLVESSESDFSWLAPIATTLYKNPYITSLYAANQSGKSIFIYRVTQDMQRSQRDIPEAAKFSINFNHTSGQQRRVFLDQYLQVISRVYYDSNGYDPRTRPWFKQTMLDSRILISEPYRFYPSQQLGITFSRRSHDGTSVVAADFDYKSLSQVTKDMTYSKHAETFLLTSTQDLIASNGSIDNTDAFIENRPDLADELIDLDRLDSLKTVIKLITVNGELSRLLITPINIGNKQDIYLINLLKENDFLEKSMHVSSYLSVRNMLFLTLFFFIISILSTRRIARPLIYLNKSLHNIQRFEYQRKKYKVSHIAEIDQLNETMILMESVLIDFFNNLYSVARSSRPEELSTSIVEQTEVILTASSCQLFVNNRDNRQAFHLTANSGNMPEFALQTFINHKQSVLDEPVYELSSADADVIFLTGRCKTGFIIPLMNRKEQSIGALVIGFEGEITKSAYDRIRLVRNFIGFNEIVLEHLEKEHEQQALFHSFVEMTAAALDTKSPYTGGHCQRVPEITEMIANAAESDTGAFADFSLTSKSREELLVAAWLHDCGKVTTPDYVMDKATKLETVYDRIHEIRMRYEVLKRDADITCLQSVANGMNKIEAEAACTTLKETLESEFAFIASCNLGSEFLAADKQVRLAEIATRTWVRTLPDNIGISQQTLAKKRTNEQALPVVETVLANKYEHLFAWDEKQKQANNGKRDFKMAQPAYRYNRGELHNLMVQAGTLTEEERYNINDHIVQTYVMLDQIMYPEHLKNVPLIAGSHHEKMNGEGYPLKLKGEEIPLGGRMIAVADIFEALTASDRPYKTAKRLSQALKIMAFMVKDEHLDHDVFDLFLTHQVYQAYADQYLKTEQIDNVDIDRLRSIYFKL